MFPPPSVVPPTLEDFQWGYAGLVFGANTPWGVLGAEGFGLADVRHQNTPWPRDHGEALGLDVFGGRSSIVFDLWDVAGGTSLQARQLELAAATNILPNGEEYLWFKLPNLPVMCVPCRVSKRPTNIDSDYAAANVAKPELALTATDPRIYGAGVSTVISPNHPASTKVLANGNMEMRPILVFTGPLARPRAANLSIAGDPFIELKHNAAREKLELEAAEAREETEDENIEKWNKELAEKTITEKERDEKEAAQKVAMEKAVKEEKEALDKEEEEGMYPTVKSGDQLLVDLGTPHRVEYYVGGVGAGGGENVMEWLDAELSTWWDLLPGDNTIQFSSFDEANTGGTLTVEWAPADQL